MVVVALLVMTVCITVNVIGVFEFLDMSGRELLPLALEGGNDEGLKASVEGAVLPVRRFRIHASSSSQLRHQFTIPRNQASGDEAKPVDGGWAQCNEACWKDSRCEAWEWNSHQDTCGLYAPNDDNMYLNAIQSVNNDAGYVIGYLQRRAQVVRFQRRQDDLSSQSRSDRILYILHSHHSIPHHVLSAVVKENLAFSLPASVRFDLVVDTPQTMSLVVDYFQQKGSGLLNPFFAYSGGTGKQSKRGTNSYMGLVMAMAKFPGYKGYLFVNDDAAIRFWSMDPSLYFDNRPWATIPRLAIPSHGRGQKLSMKQTVIGNSTRTILQHPPYGFYVDWEWWNLDSGSTVNPPPGLTRSNFDATLAALQQFCNNLQETLVDPHRRSYYCHQRPSDTIVPYIHGKGDVFYVPGNELGRNLSRALLVFGEHDVFLEIAIAMVYSMLVPDDQWVPVPYCDGDRYMDERGNELVTRKKSPGEKIFLPLYSVQGTNDTMCAVIHPLKFSKEEDIRYWKHVMKTECAACNRNSKLHSVVPS